MSLHYIAFRALDSLRIAALIWTFYAQRREIDAFLVGNRLLSRNHYFRILTMEVVILVNMVAALVMIAFDVRLFADLPGGLQFWPGWKEIHTDWQPVSVSSSEWDGSSWNRFATRWNEWINPIFAFIFFLVYGLSNPARARYRRALSSFPRLSLPYRSSQLLKEESQPQVIHLAPGSSSVSSITTKCVVLSCNRPGWRNHDILLPQTFRYIPRKYND